MKKKILLLIWVRVWLHYENILHLLHVIKSYFRILSCNCFGTRCHYDLSFSKHAFFNTIKRLSLLLSIYFYASLCIQAMFSRLVAELIPSTNSCNRLLLHGYSLNWFDAKCVSGYGLNFAYQFNHNHKHKQNLAPNVGKRRKRNPYCRWGQTIKENIRRLWDLYKIIGKMTSVTCISI